MKHVSLIFIIILPIFSMSQVKPIDTTYYPNGSIRSVLFQGDKKVNGLPVVVTYDKSDIKSVLGKKLTDTVYFRVSGMDVPKKIDELKQFRFTHFRRYYDSDIIYEYTLSKNRDELIIDKQGLTITRFFKDSAIKYLLVTYTDSITFKNKKTLVDIRFDTASYLKSQSLFIGHGQYIEIRSEKQNVIHCVFFKDEEERWHGKYIEFFGNMNLKELGYYEHGIKKGMWKEWFENGNIKSVGQYSGNVKKREDGESDFIKVGEWKYFDEDGKLLKKEDYK